MRNAVLDRRDPKDAAHVLRRVANVLDTQGSHSAFRAKAIWSNSMDRFADVSRRLVSVRGRDAAQDASHRAFVLVRDHVNQNYDL